MRLLPAQVPWALPVSVALAVTTLLPAGDTSADPENPADWSTMTATRVVFDLVWSGGQLVGAVDPGGLLFYDPATSAFTRFTTDDGLGSNRAQCLAVNDGGDLGRKRRCRDHAPAPGRGHPSPHRAAGPA